MELVHANHSVGVTREEFRQLSPVLVQQAVSGACAPVPTECTDSSVLSRAESKKIAVWVFLWGWGLGLWFGLGLGLCLDWVGLGSWLGLGFSRGRLGFGFELGLGFVVAFRGWG